MCGERWVFRTMQEAEQQIVELEQKLLNEPAPPIDVRPVEASDKSKPKGVKAVRVGEGETPWDKLRDSIGRDGPAKKKPK